MATIRWPETEDDLPPELADLVDGLAEMIARNILKGADEPSPETEAPKRGTIVVQTQ